MICVVHGNMFPIMLLLLLIDLASSQQSSSLTTHSLRKTPSASTKNQELFCYTCDSMDSLDCIDVTMNNSKLIKKCQPEEFFCAVKRISYTISTENSTSSPKMWSLIRSCDSALCKDGCIVIGERTKIYACTSCCDSSLCNVGHGSANNILQKSSWFRTITNTVSVLTVLSGFYLR